MVEYHQFRMNYRYYLYMAGICVFSGIYIYMVYDQIQKEISDKVKCSIRTTQQIIKTIKDKILEEYQTGHTQKEILQTLRQT